MRKGLVWLLAVLLLLQAAAWAQDQAHAIQDSAGVLSAATLSEAEKLTEQLRQASGVSLQVSFRHFLGGADVQAAAEQALKELADPDNSLLLLAVVGEDSYALAAGRQAALKLSRDSRDNLLSTHFRLPFLARDYDRALAAYLQGAAAQLTRGQAGSIRVDEYFPGLGTTKRPDSEVYRSLNITGGQEATEQPGAWRQRDQERDRGMSIFSIIAIGLVLSAIFGKKDKRRGCGCGPLGWIFGVFGVSKLFGWRK